MIMRTAKEVQPNPEKPNEDLKDMVEVTYSLKLSNKNLEQFSFKALNNLTSYNHVMTISEQIVKHEIRTKFMVEALSQLQKTIKDKQQNHQKQKCLIIACLTVIDSLVSF
jgi:hypothetical protein